jgi:secreted PhoX family phosphatase
MAAFLESRAYAAKMGATAEFRKMEWVALDAVNNKLYISMTEITKSMSDGEGDIQLPENPCGIVYQADLDADYNISALKPLIVGGPYNADVKENQCALDNISNPDGLFVDPQGNLWIGEDTSKHVNNFIWKWDGAKLQRFAAMPAIAEATGVLVTPNGDLIFSVQHPSSMSTYPYNRAAVVVVNGFKTTDEFAELPVPTGDAMHTLTVAAGELQVLARVGEAIPNDARGMVWGQVNKVSGERHLICNQPDGNIWMPTNAAGTEGYLYTNYECRPGTVGKMYIRQTGNGWEVLEGEQVDFASVQGTWNNCGTSLTPWGTGLTSEEYEPVATVADWKANVKDMSAFLGAQANPYDYGWNVEIAPDKYGDFIETQVTKRYALGRFSHENAMVMPDSKTVYHGDDGSNVVLFKSVADNAGDLSAATLFAAKITQNADESLSIEWIELGNASDDDIYDAIRSVTLPE